MDCLLMFFCDVTEDMEISKSKRPPPSFWPLAQKEGEADLGFSFPLALRPLQSPRRTCPSFQQDGLCDIVHVRIVWIARIIWMRNYP